MAKRNMKVHVGLHWIIPTCNLALAEIACIEILCRPFTVIFTGFYFVSVWMWQLVIFLSSSVLALYVALSSLMHLCFSSSFFIFSVSSWCLFLHCSLNVVIRREMHSCRKLSYT
ncbi:hypothetical protein PanWU01x14_260370 [Parasponia andersonii]|uniref:Transmembrane protein n=1 Tax=Parasponia andersonii TaxID=3476 RepID=A0A2P5B8U5_PARAD|nr:hypothetical protein PanWU01x14_260370 [Parasponia andersonii]